MPHDAPRCHHHRSRAGDWTTHRRGAGAERFCARPERPAGTNRNTRGNPRPGRRSHSRAWRCFQPAGRGTHHADRAGAVWSGGCAGQQRRNQPDHARRGHSVGGLETRAGRQPDRAVSDVPDVWARHAGTGRGQHRQHLEHRRIAGRGGSGGVQRKQARLDWPNPHPGRRMGWAWSACQRRLSGLGQDGNGCQRHGFRRIHRCRHSGPRADGSVCQPGRHRAGGGVPGG